MSCHIVFIVTYEHIGKKSHTKIFDNGCLGRDKMRGLGLERTDDERGLQIYLQYF